MKRVALACLLVVLLQANLALGQDKKAPQPPSKKEGPQTKPPRYTCPFGFEFDGKQCVQVLTAKPQANCPPDTYPDPHGGDVQVCVKAVSVAATFICEKGFVPMGKECVKKETAEPQFECPPESKKSKDGRHCEAQERRDGDAICPDGFSIGTGANIGKCERIITVPATLQCPKGFEQMQNEATKEKACVKFEKVQAQLLCPKGWQFNGKLCVHTVATQPQIICPPGFDRQGSLCTRQETQVLGEVQCPEGTTPGPNGQCFSETPVPSTLQCPPDFTLNASTNLCEKLLTTPPTEVCLPDMTPPPCIQRTEVSGGTQCPEGFEQVGDQCVRPNTQNAQVICPPNFELVGAQCQASETTQARVQCPKGFEIKENKDKTKPPECVRAVKERPLSVCPPGYVSMKEGCGKKETAPPETECPKGFELVKGVCVRVVSSPSQPICPPGFRLLHGVCVKEETSPGQHVCDNKFKFNPFKKTCENSIAQNPTFTCPNGYEYSGEKTGDGGDGIKKTGVEVPNSHGKYACTKIESVPGVATCDKGFQFDKEKNACVYVPTHY